MFVHRARARVAARTLKRAIANPNPRSVEDTLVVVLLADGMSGATGLVCTDN